MRKVGWLRKLQSHHCWVDDPSDLKVVVNLGAIFLDSALRGKSRMDNYTILVTLQVRPGLQCRLTGLLHSAGKLALVSNFCDGGG